MFANILPIAFGMVLALRMAIFSFMPYNFLQVNHQNVVQTLNDLIQINSDRMAIYGDAMSQLEEGYDNLRALFAVNRSGRLEGIKNYCIDN